MLRAKHISVHSTDLRRTPLSHYFGLINALLEGKRTGHVSLNYFSSYLKDPLQGKLAKSIIAVLLKIAALQAPANEYRIRSARILGRYQKHISAPFTFQLSDENVIGHASPQSGIRLYSYEVKDLSRLNPSFRRQIRAQNITLISAVIDLRMDGEECYLCIGNDYKGQAHMVFLGEGATGGFRERMHTFSYLAAPASLPVAVLSFLAQQGLFNIDGYPSFSEIVFSAPLFQELKEAVLLYYQSLLAGLRGQINSAGTEESIYLCREIEAYYRYQLQSLSNLSLSDQTGGLW